MKEKTKRTNPFSLKEAAKKEIETIPVVSTRETTLPQDMSLDQKVDRYLIQYEREAIPQSAMFPGLAQPPRATTPPAIMALQEKALFKLIFEAEEDLAAGGGDLGGDLGGGLGGAEDPAAAGAPAEEEVPEIDSPNLNIQKFSANMARLINNYDVMLDPKTVILNRAYAYIVKNYNQETANEFMVNMKKYYQQTPNNIATNKAPARNYFAGSGNLTDGGSIPTGGGIVGGGT